MPPISTKARLAAQKNGWRSGLEEAVGAQLKAAGVVPEYETLAVPFRQPEKPRRYTPDFLLPSGVVLETKGRFLSADRAKHLLVKAQHPQLELRFVFSNPNQKIGKKSSTTYALWCERAGFKYAKGLVPEAWLKEPPNPEWLKAALSLRKASK